MQQTQHSTTCQIHILPLRTIDPSRVFAVRRAAQDEGAQFIPTLNPARRAPAPTDLGPFDGGSAA